MRIAGGQPTRPRTDILSGIAERPTASSPDFTYRPSGDIVANSGARKQGGHADLTAYSQIRFPLEKTPAFAHSQSFGKGKSDERTEEYPWRDNFCEARSFEVGQCASGFGHQGQDLRAAACPPNNDGGQNCDPKQQAIVAARDGIVIRAAKQQAATLQINTRTEHIRFRYMHMNPSAMDADGLLNGRRVAEGEKIGVVSNYLDRPAGTSRHLHFDVQVFTRDGWLWVNPYTTLISAYERLIRGRGREIGPEPPAAARSRTRCRRTLHAIRIRAKAAAAIEASSDEVGAGSPKENQSNQKSLRRGRADRVCAPAASSDRQRRSGSRH